MLVVCVALANPHRLRMLAHLTRNGRTYVSQIARAVDLSRPLAILHLRKLEAAGLVTSALELSAEGKALHYYTVVDFALTLTPAAIAAAAATLLP